MHVRTALATWACLVLTACSSPEGPRDPRTDGARSSPTTPGPAVPTLTMPSPTLPSTGVRVLLDQRIATENGQFDILWGESYGFDGDYGRFYAGQVNGLVGASSGRGIHVNLARSSGSPVRIVLRRNAPGEARERWEDVVEVSVEVPPDLRVDWSTWAQESWGPLAIPPGDYRVRVGARGRDSGIRGEPKRSDAYLIEFWPAPPRPDAIVRTGSADAGYWHREVGHRR